MQKIKKSLENNILKINLNNKNNSFLIESRLENNNKYESKSYENRVLANSSLKGSELFVIAGIKEIKFPLVLKSFEFQDKLQKYFIRNLADEKFLPVLIKDHNFLYKGKAFYTLKVVNFFNRFHSLKHSLKSIIVLLQLFKIKHL